MGERSTDDVGKLYEKYLADKLGMRLNNNKRWQLDYGDTWCKTEIKYDRRLHQTGNLYFEFEECRIPGSSMVSAGVMKQGYKRYAIGDCSRAMLFRGDILRKKVEEARRGMCSRGSIKRSETSGGSLEPALRPSNQTLSQSKPQ